MTERGWGHFEHGADIGVRGFGPNLDSAFEEAAQALIAIMVDPKIIRPRVAINIACTAPDDEILLVDWLNALIYEMATRGMVFGAFDARVDDGRLSATARGEPLEGSGLTPAVEIKGATFTELLVARHANGWLAQCVIDV